MSSNPLSRLLDRQVARVCALQNSVYVAGRTFEQSAEISCVNNEFAPTST